MNAYTAFQFHIFTPSQEARRLVLVPHRGGIKADDREALRKGSDVRLELRQARRPRGGGALVDAAMVARRQ